MLIGNLLGLLAGYRGGGVDSVIMRWVDLMYALPGLLVAIVVVGIVGGGYWVAVGAARPAVAPFDTRMIRGATLEQRSLPYVEAATDAGAAARRIMLLHIWPNVSPLVVANTCLTSRSRSSRSRPSRSSGFGVAPGTAGLGADARREPELLFDNPVAAFAPGRR